MAKVMFLTRSLGYGGAERQMVALAQGLQRHGHSISVANFYSGGPLGRELPNSGILMYDLGKWGRWDIVGFLFRLALLLRREHPDVLHSYQVVPNLLTIILKPLFPGVRMIWGVRTGDMDLSEYDWFVRLTFRLSCYLAHFADLIIVNSRSGMKYHRRRGYPEGKMAVVPNGIDTTLFYPDLSERQRVRAEWGVKGDEKLVGLVARLDPVKNHPTFLEAAAILSRETENIRFVCVGNGGEGYKRRLLGMARDLKIESRLIWCDSRDDVRAVYNALDLACSCSHGEGFSNVVAEAMACGVPCIVTDAGDSAWIVGDTGEVVNPRDPRDVSRGIRSILAGDNKRDPARIRGRISHVFSLDRMVEQTERLLLG